MLLIFHRKVIPQLWIRKIESLLSFRVRPCSMTSMLFILFVQRRVIFIVLLQYSVRYVSNVYKSLPNLDGEVEDDKKAKVDKADIDANLQVVLHNCSISLFLNVGVFSV